MKKPLFVVSLVACGLLSSSFAQSEIEIEATVSNGLLSTKFDVPDNNPRMLVGHFRDGAWGIMRAGMTFELDGIPEGASIVSASLSIFARSAPWAPANPDGSPTMMVVKDAGQLFDDGEIGFPLAWGSFEVEGGDVSGAALSQIAADDYKGGISEENAFASSEAFVAAVQAALDAGRDAIHLVVHCPEMDEADPKPPGKNFYRIDNHENEEETIPRLHLAFAADSDGDAMGDAWELSFFPGDLSKLAKGQDNDGDGLADDVEFLWKSDPTKTDSDGDTLSDGDEVNTHGSDPSKTDSDGDGISDDQEVAANPFVTDPGKADTDGDGLADNVEITQNSTDPTKQDSDGDSYDDGLEVRLGSNPASAESSPGLLSRGGMWTVLHAEIPDFGSIEELDEIIETEDYFDSVVVELPIVNFDNLVAGDYSESDMNYPLFEEPTTGVPTLLRVTGIIDAKAGGQVTLGFNTASEALLRIDGEEIEMFEIGRANSGRIAWAATLNLAAGAHEVEFLHWFSGAAGVYLMTAYEAGEIDEFVKEDFELMPAAVPPPIVDTDGDGLPDGYEDANGLDKSVADAALDKDGDGLSNLEEFGLKTDPSKGDTDGDGLSDKVETNTKVWVGPENTGTHPLRGDSDKDGLLDGVETNTQTFIDGNNTGTNPLLADSDGDGASDGLEVTGGSNPVDTNSVASNQAGGGVFTVEHVWTDGLGTIGDIAAAEDFLDNPEGGFQTATVESKWIHFHDSAEPPFFLEESVPYPLWADEGFGDRDDFAIRARGQINIKNAGIATFVVNSDDGFVLRIDGEDLGEAGNRGRGNTVMTVDLTAGVHDLELIHYERGGGSGITVTLYRGTGEAPDPDGSNFELLEAFGGGAAPFEIVDVARTPGADPKLNVTWTSNPGETFTIATSTDLQAWQEETDGYPSGGATTTFEHALSDGDPPSEFYIRAIRE